MTEPEATAAPRSVWRRDAIVLALLVTLAFAHGALYAAIQWPWYAPDETDHVEYALLTQRYGLGVTPADIDPALRRQIVRSRFDWFIETKPPAEDDPAPGTWAGQVGRQPPLYYWLTGWAAALAPASDLVAQLYAMRLVSVALGAATVGLIYVAGRLLAPGSLLLGLGMAGYALVQTQFSALSGSVTNDSLAIMSFSLVLVVALALLRRRPAGWGMAAGVAALAGALALTYCAKRTASAVAPAALLALGALLWPALRRWARGWRRWLMIGALVVLVAGLAIVSIDTSGAEAARWAVDHGRREASNAARSGRYVVALGADGQLGSLRQELRQAVEDRLDGQPATFGAWLRLAEDGTPQPAIITLWTRNEGKTQAERGQAMVGGDWQFVSVTGQAPRNVDAIGVSVEQAPGATGSLLVDGMALAVGQHTGEPATWGDVGATDELLLNGSFEETPFRFRPWLSQILSSLAARDINLIIDGDIPLNLVALSDDRWQLRIWDPFSQSLWGRLGRLVEVSMPDWWSLAHTGLLLGALGGVLGRAVLAIWRRPSVADLQCAAALALGGIGSLAVSLGPYLLGLFDGPPFGRYFLVSLLPLAALYIGGLVWIWPSRARPPALLALLTVLAALDGYALFFVLPLHYSLVPPLLP